LTIESHTEFHRYPPQLPEDETLWEIQEQGFELLRTAGYRQYEISAFSQPGCQSRHNINYWEFGDYIGIGAGAHGKLTDLLNGQILRRSKQRQPKAYLEKSSPFCTTHRVTAEEMPLEFMMNALRLHEGVPDRYFAERTGLSLADIAKTLASAREKGLMKPSRIAPTSLGRRYLNDLLGLFL
jgi:oxygen-independent coproporphyrinogen-3 oxidase